MPKPSGDPLLTGPRSLQPRTDDPVKLAGMPAVRGGLPVDLLQDIARRLQILCGIVPVVATTGALATRITGTGAAGPFLFDGVLLFWVSSLVMFAVIRRGQLPAQRLLDLGMVYGIVIAGIAALVTVPHTWLVTPRQSLLWLARRRWE